MGNSEVGHLNIGAGRVIYQDFTRIDHAIETGEFARNPRARRRRPTRRAARRPRCTCWGCCRRGGVHSHERQIAALVDLAAARGVRRDLRARVPRRPRHAAAQRRGVARVHGRRVRAPPGGARIASIVGRYYAMDRDQRWERVAPAYDLLVDGGAPFTAGPRGDGAGAPPTRAARPTSSCRRRRSSAPARPARDGRRRRRRVHELPRRPRAPDDARADRSGLRRLPARARAEARARTCASRRYGDEFAALPVAFAPQTIRNSFGEYVAGLGLTQLRIAETEKYAHVTYFFNGGVEDVYPGEDRILVPSPKVATYDLKPEMSAPEVTDKLVAAIASRQVRRHRLQLRQRRHGRPHRQLRRGEARGRDARRLHRPRRRGRARRRRRGADHRRPRQRRDACTTRPPASRTRRTR